MNITIQKSFDKQAEIFDELIIKLIPYYQEMINALVNIIPFNTNNPIKIMDIGCGTGTISYLLKQRFPNAQITCLDISSEMIKQSRKKLQGLQDINFIRNDINSYYFNDKYDAIVSSLTLHHLRDDNQKIKMYSKIFQALHSSGVFYNADVILGSSPYNQAFFMKKWIEYMSKYVAREDIDNKWIISYHDQDVPAIHSEQIDWLKAIGFKGVDTIWKYYNFAVYGGHK